MHSRSRRALLVTLVSLSGCQSIDLTADLDTYSALYNEAGRERCYCYLDIGFSSLDECYDTIDDVSQADTECMDAALDGHRREGQEYLDCMNAALDDYVECLTADVSCEPGVNATCTSAYTIVAGNCDQLPTDTKAAFDACNQ